MGHISVFALFAICFFGRFGQFLCSLAALAHFLGFSGNLCVLRAIVSYKVTRGIILVVGRVIKKFWGVSGGFGGVTGALGGPTGVQRVHSTQKRHFLPLWMSCKAPVLGPNTA